MAMHPAVEPLFRPFTVKTLSLRNRIVMAPMTRSFSPRGVPGPNVAAYYQRRAENGVGLIVTEGTVVPHPSSSGYPDVPRLFGSESLNGWAGVVSAVHDAGGRIVPQLWHVGTVRKPGWAPSPDVPRVGPSGLAGPGEAVGEPMTLDDIEAVISAFGEAASNAVRLGFDGLELHGAHGYLIDQFFWERTNQRTDEWGGDLVARTRFAVRVIEECRGAVGPSFPILFRFSQWKLQDYDAKPAATPAELARWLEPLAQAGVDMFHCSTRRFWEPEFAGSPLNLAGWTKRLTGRPAITVGSVGLDNDFVAGLRQGKVGHNVGLETLVGMIDREEVDLAAIGRALLVDPSWAVKIRDCRGSELVPFTPEATGTLY